jgi:hypothetical protein
MDQVSRFLDRGVRAGMQRVVVERAETAGPPDEGVAPAMDLRAIMRGRFKA